MISTGMIFSASSPQAAESRGWDFLWVPPPAGYCGCAVPPKAGKGRNAAVSEAMDGEVPLLAGKRREHASRQLGAANPFLDKSGRGYNMKRRNSFRFVLLAWSLVIAALFLISPAPAGNEVDDSLYARLLKNHVKNGLVDYNGFKRDEAELDQYLKVLENTDPKGLSRDGQFAFYVNAYNAWTIKLVLGAYPGLESIKDIGGLFKSPWKKKICRIDGDVISLDHIEHEILRPRFKDPRVHFAINCASVSCPPLRAEPYEGRILNQQLDEMAASYINDSNQNRLEGNILYASAIFDWFGEDFNEDVPGFFLKYAGVNLKKRLEANRENIKIKYLDYDWSLNGK
jgi:hypothetical protein